MKDKNLLMIMVYYFLKPVHKMAQILKNYLLNALQILLIELNLVKYKLMLQQFFWIP